MKMLQRSAKGFTLLEVMIAIAILAIALTTLLGNQSQSLRFADESQFAFIASRLAQQKFSEIEASGDDLYTTDGEFGDDNPGYFWSFEVDDPDFEDHPALAESTQFVKRVVLKIHNEDESKSYSISRYMLTGVTE